MEYIIGQTAGIIVTVGSLIGPLFKKKWMMLVNSILLNALAALNVILVSGMGSAVFLNCVGALQASLSLYHIQKIIPVTKIEKIIFMALYIGMGIFGAVTAPGFVFELSYKNLLEILPIIAAAFFCIATFIRSEQITRMYGVANYVLWLVYYIAIGSTTAFAQIAGLATTCIALYKYREKGEKKNEDKNP